MEVLQDVMYVENGVRKNFIKCVIKTSKILVIVQTDGDLVGGC
jgi:hypothetical protein